ncbi:MAG: hypothetical protein AAB437_01975 [Patescibacteria group bacterium]
MREAKVTNKELVKGTASFVLLNVALRTMFEVIKTGMTISLLPELSSLNLYSLTALSLIAVDLWDIATTINIINLDKNLLDKGINYNLREESLIHNEKPTKKEMTGGRSLILSTGVLVGSIIFPPMGAVMVYEKFGSIVNMKKMKKSLH